MLKRGFTLIELLVVIAVLGVLATVVIVAINPLQQLARGRDAGRLSTVEQLGQATVTYATANSSTYPTANATWITTLVNAGEISSVPGVVTYGGGVAACTTNAQNGFCYKESAATGPVVVYARVEALSNSSHCPAGQSGWFVYSSADGRSGGVCSAAEPAAGAQAFKF